MARAAFGRRFLQPTTTPVTDHQEFPVREILWPAAEAWGAALLMAPTWVLASVAAWRLPMLLRWLAGVAVCGCGGRASRSQWASASVYLLPPQQGYRPAPNHRRCLEGPRFRIESKRCGPPSYSRHRGLP